MVPVHPVKNAPRGAPAEEPDDNGNVENDASNESQFQPAIPIPPIVQYSADFECPFCFQFIWIRNASDWTEHIEEDLAPYICIFPGCLEFSSFERVLDWIHHENTRHRRIEWWRCVEEGCAHLSTKHHDFIEHLVHEHDIPEPTKYKRACPRCRHLRQRVKHYSPSTLIVPSANIRVHCSHWQAGSTTDTSNTPTSLSVSIHTLASAAKPTVKASASGLLHSSCEEPGCKFAVEPSNGTQHAAQNQSHLSNIPTEKKLFLIVEHCRHKTNKQALDEPCCFCGDMFDSFKHLLAHIAGHQQQLALPILELVKAKSVVEYTTASLLMSCFLLITLSA